jgi:formylglycine-generating enzyme required for sulfatase activity
MIRIPKGWFVYGGVGSGLALRWKRLPTYWIDRTEVTQAAYRECVQAGACVSVVSSQRASFDLPQQPVTMVNWYEAAAYCRFRQKRLPSSKEWEKAARGIDGQIFAFRSTLPSCRHAVHGRPLQPPFACPMHPEGPMPVASKPLDRSPFGVMDMSGNVSEWINDCAQKRADGACLERFARGGNWHSHAAELLAARRWASPPQTRQWDLGFRCAWP